MMRYTQTKSTKPDMCIFLVVFLFKIFAVDLHEKFLENNKRTITSTKGDLNITGNDKSATCVKGFTFL